MNFQQLRIVRETVRQNFNLTEVANVLHTSQSGVSKHIKDLEDELGVELYVRKGKRLLGLTEPGSEMIKLVERMLLDANNIKNLANRYSHQDAGEFTVAATHTQARYLLPSVIVAFKKRYPKVHLRLHQGSPKEIVQMLLTGEADVGLATESLGDIEELAAFPLYRWRHSVVVPKGHSLANSAPVTLQAIAQHPIITYHEGFTGRARVEKAFVDAGITPDIVLSALDADVIKYYVELGVGIGIIASIAFSKDRDHALEMLDTEHLFLENQTKLAVRRSHMLRAYVYHFIEMCSPELVEAEVRRLSEDA